MSCLTHHEERRDRGEISPRTFQGLHSTCAGVVKVFGKKLVVTDLGPNDFGRLRRKLAEPRKTVALRNEMQRVGIRVAAVYFLVAFLYHLPRSGPGE